MTSNTALTWPSIFLLLFLYSAIGAGAREKRGREGKFFNVFQIVTFQNDACNGGNMNGTCFTEAECSSRGGTNAGSCASGFGVCCVITLGCGATTSDNCTYFTSQNVMAGNCQVEICPANDNICQLRLDFDMFTITGPSTLSTSVAKRKMNSGELIFTEGTISLSNGGQCLVDSFSVTNPSGPSPPTICGANTGEHMYVESSDCCNQLAFKLGSGVGAQSGTSLATRSWQIKVTQFSCNSNNLAPEGCVQYFFGQNGQTVQSFNFDGGNGRHLANQDQHICVRRERGNCRICWSAIANADFGLSGTIAGQNINNHRVCCSYAAAQKTQSLKGFDCLQIPGARTGDSTPVPRNSHLCGNQKGLNGKTTCSTTCPFAINFRSDEFEVTDSILASEAKGENIVNRGFRLAYFMDAVGCSSSSNRA